MDSRTIIDRCFTDNIATIEKVRNQNTQEIESIADMVYRTFNNNNRILI